MKRLLLVEDNDLNLNMLTRRLTRRGFEVITASDGAEALRQAREQQPDLVLMDVSLPVMDGLQVTRALRSDPVTRAIPVIALTAHVLAEDRDQCLQAGCDDFHAKPLDFGRLLEAIERLTQSHTVP